MTLSPARRLVVIALALMPMGGCAGSSPGTPSVVRVDVTDAGFTPATTQVRKGQPVVVVFARNAEQTCATDVVFPALHRGYDLPLHKEVRVELSAADIGDTLRFNCSGEVLHGQLVAN